MQKSFYSSHLQAAKSVEITILNTLLLCFLFACVANLDKTCCLRKEDYEDSFYMSVSFFFFVRISHGIIKF